jgi:uncharacterized protein (TIGR02453 family)
MSFRGWPAEALEFFDELAADNSKAFWTAHKGVYEEKVYAPMAALVDELAPEFGPVKIFRPYRDVRFSADKTPYKTQIAALLGQGFVRLDATGLGVGAGMHMMDREQLARYRAAVDAEASGRALQEVIASLAAKKIEVRGHELLVRVPRGFAADHPRAELLKCKGLVAWAEWPAGAWLGRATARDRVVQFLRATAPLNGWLTAHVGPAELD